MQKNLIFFDIDGTICPYGADPAPEVYEAFRLLKAKGNIAFLCTGRGQADIPGSILELGFDGIISSMGADIFICGELVQHQYIPRELLEETVSALIENKIAAMLVGQRDVLRTEYISATPLETGVVRSVTDLHRGVQFPHISSIDLEYESLRGLEPCMPALRKHSLLVEYTSKTGQTKLLGVSKSDAICMVRALPAYRGLKTYGIGDSQNDIDMLKAVDIGIAMGNAPKEVLQAGDYITDALENHGLYNALKHFDLM